MAWSTFAIVEARKYNTACKNGQFESILRVPNGEMGFFDLEIQVIMIEQSLALTHSVYQPIS